MPGQDRSPPAQPEDRQDGVRVLTLGSGTGGALDPEERRALQQALAAAQADQQVRAIVLRGPDGTFSAGVNVMEYGGDLAAPWVDVLTREIEQGAKPVVAAIEGVALGAGFALALAAHGRVAHEAARVGLPDVKLGVVPAGGATQRLPRLVGAQAALAMMLPGRVIAATDPGLKHVFDHVVAQDVTEAAEKLAAQLADSGRWSRTCDRAVGLGDPAAYLRSVGTAAASVAREDSAEAGIVRAVEAALLLPFDQGLALEADLFDETRRAPAARAARHMLMVDRRAARVPGVDMAQARAVREVVLTGRRGAFVETAIMALDAGWHVYLHPVRQADAPAMHVRVAEVYEGAVARGRMDAAARDARMARLHVAEEGTTPPAAQLVCELGGAGMPVPGDAIRVRLDDTESVRPDPDGPQLWARLHAPAHSAPLAEVAIGKGAAPADVATLVQALTRARKTVIRAGTFPGMIGHNLTWALWSAALVLAEAGQDPFAIDAAAGQLGFARGPFRQMDAEGLAVVIARLDHLGAARGAPPLPENSVLRQLARDGQTGRRAGRGFYLYAEGQARPAPDVLTRLDALQAAPHPALEAAEPGAALEAAIINEAARLLAQSVAARASDIDAVLVKGLGVARARGGLLIQADMKGLFAVLQVLKSLDPAAPQIWAPQPAVLEMVKNGVGFFGRP